MARKPVLRSLPALAALHPEFRGFASHLHLLGAITQMLRRTIEEVRTPQTRPFYSVREAATFFGVSPPTIAASYRQLEAEGLLVRIRGSQTLLAGRKIQPRHPIRGVVGIVIPLAVFLYGLESRAFYISLEEELRHQRYVADFIFCRMPDSTHAPPNLLDQLLAHELDLVCWYAPDRCMVPVMQQLQDGGVQLVTLSDGKAHYPREQYFLDLWRGIVEGVAAWQAAGVDYVAVVGPERAYGNYERQIQRHVLEACGMEHGMFAVSDAEAPRVLQRLSRRSRVGVILFRYYWYAALCDKFPQVMERLFQSCRVMLCQGALIHGYLEGKEVFADCVTIPYEAMARRVARDIGSGKVATTARLATFRTVHQPRVNLGKPDLTAWGLVT